MLQSDLRPTLLGQEAPVVSPRVSPRHLHLDGDGGAGGGALPGGFLREGSSCYISASVGTNMG